MFMSLTFAYLPVLQVMYMGVVACPIKKTIRHKDGKIETREMDGKIFLKRVSETKVAG